jgi:hypothetical protein
MGERFGVLIHLYCLMPNHYHLSVETPRGNLSQSIGWLQVTYTVRFNRRHRRSGHLFQGRFKAHLVEADEYARTLVCYVHLNPVRPRDRTKPVPPERAEELAQYPWSSHLDYAGLRPKSPAWLNLEWRRYWGRTAQLAHQEYQREMTGFFGRAARSLWDKVRGGLVLGSDRLWDQVRSLLRQKEGEEELRWEKRIAAREMAQRVQKMLGGEKDNRIRIWGRIRLGGERNAVLAREMGYQDGTAIAHVVRRLEHKASNDKRLRQRLEQLKRRCHMS